MGKFKFLIALPACVLVACSGNGNRDKADLSGCYSFEKNGNHVELSLVDSGSKITGELDYSISEKDKNAGSVTGVKTDKVLVLDYRFQSEGTQSLREVAFRIDGNTLVEGYGAMHEENEKMVFDNPKKLSFPKAVVLKRVSCD